MRYLLERATFTIAWSLVAYGGTLFLLHAAYLARRRIRRLLRQHRGGYRTTRIAIRAGVVALVVLAISPVAAWHTFSAMWQEFGPLAPWAALGLAAAMIWTAGSRMRHWDERRVALKTDSCPGCGGVGTLWRQGNGASRVACDSNWSAFCDECGLHFTGSHLCRPRLRFAILDGSAEGDSVWNAKLYDGRDAHGDDRVLECRHLLTPHRFQIDAWVHEEARRHPLDPALRAHELPAVVPDGPRTRPLVMTCYDDARWGRTPVLVTVAPGSHADDPKSKHAGALDGWLVLIDPSAELDRQLAVIAAEARAVSAAARSPRAPIAICLLSAEPGSFIDETRTAVKSTMAALSRGEIAWFALSAVEISRTQGAGPPRRAFRIDRPLSGLLFLNGLQTWPPAAVERKPSVHSAASPADGLGPLSESNSGPGSS